MRSTVRPFARGFTLIEVMVTVAIVAILAGVALPSYREYVRRGAVVDGPAALSRLRVKLEQYYQDQRNYGVDSCGQGTLNLAEATKFDITCAVLDGGQKYLITATGKTGSTALGHTYTVDEANTQATTNYKGGAVTKACWVMRGDEC